SVSGCGAQRINGRFLVSKRLTHAVGSPAPCLATINTPLLISGPSDWITLNESHATARTSSPASTKLAATLCKGNDSAAKRAIVMTILGYAMKALGQASL